MYYQNKTLHMHMRLIGVKYVVRQTLQQLFNRICEALCIFGQIPKKMLLRTYL